MLTSTTLTQLWTLTAGANVIRRTTFDQTLTYMSNTYATAPLQPSAFDEQGDLTPNQMEIAVDLTGSGITEAALVGTTWDRARLLIQVIDFLSLGAAPVRKWQGFLARADVQNGQLSRCEFLSISHLLNQPIGHLYSPTCRVAEYGDAECGKNIAAETFTGTVQTVTDSATFRVNVNQAVANYFQFGTCRFTSGANNGIDKFEIKTSAANGANTDLLIIQEFPFAVMVGDAVTIVRGCDREFATCKDRDNALRFRGEPDIPGLAKLFRRFPE
jgi:uncharacterized phage protein (TIGR02218 family)